MNIKLAHSKSLEYQLLPELREAYGQKGLEQPGKTQQR